MLNLKVGDKVRIAHYRKGYTPHWNRSFPGVVEKVTKAKLLVNGTWYPIATGVNGTAGYQISEWPGEPADIVRASDALGRLDRNMQFQGRMTPERADTIVRLVDELKAALR